jgi:hypothetical protein
MELIAMATVMYSTDKYVEISVEILRYCKKLLGLCRQTKGGIKMGLRAYLLVDVADDMKQEEFIKTLRELEEIPGVDFVDPVIGSKDLVIMVDAPVTVEAIANKIRAKSWHKNLEILRIVSMFERHRASKNELLKALSHGGL